MTLGEMALGEMTISLLPEDRANEYERSLKITKPFENMNDGWL